MTTSNSTHRRGVLQQEQGRLLARLAAIEAELAELELTEAVQEVCAATPRTGQHGAGSKGGDGWVEVRMVNGCGPYAYRRWYEGAKKRSEYLGKVLSK